MAGVERHDVSAPPRRSGVSEIGEALQTFWQRVRPWVTSTAFLCVVLAVIAWPGRVSPLVPQPGLDPSWHAALAMATHQRLPFGTRIVFTFGPLGFLSSSTLYYANTAIVAFVFRFCLAAATFAVLLAAIRRYVSLVIAVPVAYVSGFALIGVLPSDEAAIGVAFALCVDRLSEPADAPKADWKWIAFGGIAGLFALEKLSIGLAIGVLLVIAIWCVPGRRRRALVLAGVPAFVVFVVGWFATGNGFGNLLSYVRTSLETAAGYSAMAYDPVADHHNALILAAIGFVAILTTAVAFARRLAAASPAADADVTDARRWKMLVVAPAPVGLVLATVFTSWLLFKEAFVRQDTHRIIFLSSVPLLLAGLLFADRTSTRLSARPWLTRRNGLNLVVALLLFSFFGFEVLGSVPGSLTDPAGAAGGFLTTVRTLVVPQRRHDLMDSARQQLEQGYNLPPGMLARISGQTVAVVPYEQTVAWAFPTLRWDPLPVIQDYAAYTNGLDLRNVDFIESAKAPQFILRQPPSATIDGRIAAFDPPATQLAVECNYREVSANAAWQLVERTPNRCGAPARIETKTVPFGKPLVVPEASAGSMVVGTFDLHLSVWWKLVDRAYKPPQVRVVNQDGAVNRFIVGTAANSHVLRPASTLGYSAPFAPTAIDSLTFVCSGGTPCPSRVTVAYSSISMR
jgi:hypothetical protein